jgi:hypothetical protein
MSTALKRYPNRLDPNHWCPNGSIPDAFYIRQAANALNHILGYRRKVVMTAHGPFGTMGYVGTSVDWRGYFKSGVGASKLRFKLLCGQDRLGVGDPNIGIWVTPSGSSPSLSPQIRIDYGSYSGYSNDELFTLATFTPETEIDPLTAYEIQIKSTDGGRPIAVSAIEVGHHEVDESVDYFAELAASVFQPIDDKIREKILLGLSETWLANGAMLLSWPGNGAGTASTITGTTAKNILDGTSTSVTASSPGWQFNSAGSGLRALETLLPLVRLSGGNDLPVTFAAYANASTGTGQVLLRESGGGGGVNINSIGTTLQWYTSDTTWSNVDSLPGSGKVDILAKHSSSGVATISVYAVALMTRAA